MRVPVAPLAIGLTALLAVLSVVALTVGTADVSVGQCARFLWASLTGGTISAEEAGNFRIITRSRIPRVAMAILVGAGLSIVGVMVQAMVRNALADPYVLGISSGASVGATAVVIYGSLGALGVYALSASAFLGALASTAAVYLVARTAGGLMPLRLILTGTAIGYGLAAVTALLVFLAPHGDGPRSVMFWLLGSLGAVRWEQIPLAVVATVVGLLVVLLLARRLNALAMGDEVAASLGLHPARFRGLLFVLSAAMTSIYVSFCGAIGFVGLVMPHLARMLVGADHRRLMVIAPLLGAVFLVAADMFARTAVPPQELPLGAITAAVGVPVFLVLMRRRGALTGGA